MNLRFEYLYRDVGNFKKWGDVIFSNSNSVTVEAVIEQIIENLDYGLYFQVEDLKLPDLHFKKFNISIDHIWHEFVSCTTTIDPISDLYRRDIQTIIAAFVALLTVSK